MTTPLKFPISANHKDYAPASKKWKRCRDAIGGSDSIKAAGTEYLPALSIHKNGVDGAEKYEAYKKRALFYNAARRTRIGLSGAATMRPVRIVAKTEKAMVFAKRIAKTIKQQLDEILEVSRICIVVNQLPDRDPFHTLWWAESIVNWKIVTDDEGNRELTMLVLEDDEEEEINDYEKKTVKVRHSYILNEERLCIYSKWQKNDKDEWLKTIEDTVIRATGGRPVDFLPAILVDAMDVNESWVCDPILLDLVDVNISHYQNSADLEHGRHWTALPTAVASGFPMVDKDGNDIEFNIGGESAWITDVSGASAQYLEFSGSGLGHLAQGMMDKQSMMAILGARLLESAKPSVESSETLKTRMTGDKSVLSRIGDNISVAATWALNTILFFAVPGHEVVEDDNTITLDTDFFDKTIDPSQLQSLTSALQAGGISYETYFARLQNAEIIPAERTVEEERTLIDRGAPGPKPSPFLNGGGFGG